MNLQKLCWELTDWKKIKNIVVEFELISESGYTVIVTKRTYPLKKLVPIYNNWQVIREKEKDISEKNRGMFNKTAKEILIDFQKKKIQHLTVGKCYSGKFIVKCVWDVSFELEPMTFEEYKQAGKIIKEEARQKKEWKNAKSKRRN